MTAFVPGRSARPQESLSSDHHAENLRYAVDLFNHGYYWEAHEVWEHEWIAAGRCGPWADLIKGCIKLAAAGVKAREGRPAGIVRHGMRAKELFVTARTNWPSSSTPMVHWDWDELLKIAAGILRESPRNDDVDGAIPCRMWPWTITWKE